MPGLTNLTEDHDVRVNNFLNGARNVTDADAALAIAYYPLLIDLAERRQTMTFKAFVDLAKETYPDNSAVQSAIPISTGRRLEFVRVFTALQGLPDLSAWVTGRNGGNSDAFQRDFDPDEQRRLSAEVDWSAYAEAWEAHAAELRKRAARITRRTDREAISLMAELARKLRPQIEKAIPNPKKLPYVELVGPYRETILQDLMSGLDPEEVFKNVLLDMGNAEA
jgi:hypothetical protein